jgi:hypothetical protein
MYVAEEMVRDVRSNVSTLNNLHACREYCHRLWDLMEEEVRLYL